jgi:hypothetical protein
MRCHWFWHCWLESLSVFDIARDLLGLFLHGRIANLRGEEVSAQDSPNAPWRSTATLPRGTPAHLPCCAAPRRVIWRS